MNQATDKGNPFLAGWEQQTAEDNNNNNLDLDPTIDTKVPIDTNDIPSTFDPFETIIDDDSSLSSSPGLHATHNEPTIEIKMSSSSDHTANSQSNNINSVHIDDAYTTATSDLFQQQQHGELASKQFGGGDHYDQEERSATRDDDRDDESLRKSLRIDLDQEYHVDRDVENTMNEITDFNHDCIEEENDEELSINHDNRNTTMPMNFFDPFETVIDKDALNTPMNPKYFEDELTVESAIEISNDNSLNSFDTIRQEEQKNQEVILEEVRNFDAGQADDPTEQVQQQAVNNCVEEEEAETMLKASDEGMSKQNHREEQLEEEPTREIEIEPLKAASAAAAVTPAKVRSARQRRKPSFQEDSSDEDDEDDRIQIVIRAKDSGDVTRSHGASFVPLLPPPPSKSSIKQARERGLVEDMPSPIITHCRKSANSVNQTPEPPAFALDDDLHHHHHHRHNTTTTTTTTTATSVTTGDGNHQKFEKDFNKKSNRKKRGSDDDDFDELDDDEDDINDDNEADNNKQADDGAFVIGGAGTGGADTPLYDDDTSYVLEEFPPKFTGPGWNMMLRYPPKKKLTSNRFWKRIFVKIATSTSAENYIVLQVYENPDEKPVQEIRLQPTYTISEISTQQYDQFGKIFTLKIQYIFYRERVGVRPGQLARLVHSGHIGSSTTSGGHGVGPTSIGDLKRYGAPLEHVAQVSQIIKLGCQNYDDVKQLKYCLEDELFKMTIARDKPMSFYKTEEIQMAVRDEIYIECNQVGTITKQLARVRLFFLSFMNGMPWVEVGINDIHRQGKEIVGRLDILPVVTEEWIRIEAQEFHCTVDKEEFEKPDDSRMIKLSPPDGVFFELMRFRVRPPRNRELPLQISGSMCVTRTKVTINCDVIVPGCTSRKHGQIPCEDIAIRIYVPECWIYFFRTEKHFRYGSVKSTNKRAGKVKGIERFLGGGQEDSNSLIEVTSGQAKYEHQHNAIVWRAARWPKENQSAYVQNSLKIKMPLTIYDKMPETFNEYIYVEYTMPATTVSHTTLRSISVNPCEGDEPPEKYVKYSANYEYKVKMRLSINLNSNKPDNVIEEKSPIIIMKQPDAPQDLIRQEDSDDDDSDFSEEKENDHHHHQQQQHQQQKKAYNSDHINETSGRDN